MKIICICTSYWRDREHAAQQGAILQRWADRVRTLFNPSSFVVGIGDNSNMALQPAVPVSYVQSFAKRESNYNTAFADYWSCAFSALAWHLLVNKDWDLAVNMATDTICGTIKNPVVMLELFQNRPELVMAPEWYGLLETNFSVWKREALAHYVHHRRKPNLNSGPNPAPVTEAELADIFKSLWWNPFGTVKSIRQDYGYPHALSVQECQRLPFVRMPSPAILKHFEL